MAIITGTTLEITGESMFPKGVGLRFALERANVRGSTIFTTEPAHAVSLMDGSWSVNLAETVNMKFAAKYKVTIVWLATGMTYRDFPSWDLHVPPGGGAFGDLIALGSSGGSGSGGPNLSMVRVSLTRPANLAPGQLWLKSDPNDPDNINGLNTGELYMGGS